MTASTISRFEEHSSLDAALLSGMRDLDSPESSDSVTHLRGSTITAVSWSDSDLSVVLDDREILVFFANDSFVNYATKSMPKNYQVSDIDFSELLLDYGFEEGPATWDRPGMYQRFVDRSFIDVVRSGGFVFLYLSGLPVCLLCVLRCVEDNVEFNMLNCCFSD